MKLPRLDNLTIRQLRVYCTVARHLSYTRAAEELEAVAEHDYSGILVFTPQLRLSATVLFSTRYSVHDPIPHHGHAQWPVPDQQPGAC
jgi:hypothetical protein